MPFKSEDQRKFVMWRLLGRLRKRDVMVHNVVADVDMPIIGKGVDGFEFIASRKNAATRARRQLLSTYDAKELRHVTIESRPLTDVMTSRKSSDFWSAHRLRGAVDRLTARRLGLAARPKKKLRRKR